MTWLRSSRSAPLAVSVLAVFALVACGDDDDAGTTTPSSPVEVTASAPDVTTDVITDDTTDDTTDVTTDVTTDITSDDTTDGTATADEDAYVVAAAEALGLGDPDTSECIARALVDGIGMDRIEASGVSPEEFTSAGSLDDIDLAIAEEDAPDMEDAMTDCGDLVEAFLSSSQVTDEQADCARPELTDELVAELIVTQLAGLTPSPELEATRTAIQSCAAG